MEELSDGKRIFWGAAKKILGLSASERMTLMIVCGLLQVAAYYAVSVSASDGAHLAVAQPDTLLYCQAAKQIAAGTPFVYSPGEGPSTGITSHVYPFLLAALYKGGATGDALFTAGFVMNAFFYLLFLACWGGVADRLLAERHVKAGACLLLALNGQAVYTALAQSDIGLFMAVSAGLFLALLAGRVGWFAFLLVLSPWCRPEGTVLSVLYAGVLFARRLFFRQRVSLIEWMTAGLAVMSAAGVFAFNEWLTGCAQFHSVYYKGYFKIFDFISATMLSLGDFIRVMRENFLGVPEALPREYLFLPVLGALFAWVGLFTKKWTFSRDWKEMWWLAASGAAILIVAASGWQNTNSDRYLSWLFPVWLIYTARGALKLPRILDRRALRLVPMCVVVVFHVCSSFWFLTTFFSANLKSTEGHLFAKELQEELPPGASFGGSGSDLVYATAGRRFGDLFGLFSPEFLTREPVMNIERMKHRKELRFDFWTFHTPNVDLDGVSVEALCGPVLCTSMRGPHARAADWSLLDRAMLPPGGERTSDGWRLVDSLDVGLVEDEIRCKYDVYCRFPGTSYTPVSQASCIGTNRAFTVFEVGRVVMGGDSMTVRLVPGLPVRVYLRSAEEIRDVKCNSGAVPVTVSKCNMRSPLKIRVLVDNVDAGIYDVPILPGNAFSDVALTVPASVIRNPETRLSFFGDHLAFAYWFYQPVP